MGVILGKLPASTTAKSQACDAGKLFSNTKAYAMKASVDEVSHYEMLKKSIVDSVVTIQDTKYKKVRSMNQYDKSRIPSALIKCVIGITKGYKHSTIRSSFDIVGVMSDNTINCSQIFQQYSFNLNSGQISKELHICLYVLAYVCLL